MPDERPSDRIVIAVVARPQGLRGAVRVKVYNPDTEILAPGARVEVAPKNEPPRRTLVRAAQPGKETWVVSFDGCTTIEAAEALRGAEISVRRDELPPPEEGEYYHADLVGCAVHDVSGAPFGIVRDVVSYPGSTVLVVAPTEGAELEVPFVDGIIVEVDMATRIVKVDRSLLAEG